MLVNFTDFSNGFTEREVNGNLSRDLGLMPSRLHNPGRRDFPHWHVAYAHPPMHHPWKRG